MLLVSWMDNIVRPLVISNATRMPFLLVVFGVLGGVLAFGLVGLFIGPVLLAVSLAIWREWLEQHQTAAQRAMGLDACGRLSDAVHAQTVDHVPSIPAGVRVTRRPCVADNNTLSMRTPSMSMISILRSRQVSVSPACGMRPSRASTKPATV